MTHLGEDPARAHPGHSDLDSRIALAGHPIHAMLVAFPIAGSFATLGADFSYWLTGDVFWPRVALWTSGCSFAAGGLAAASGLAELLLVPGVRRRAAAWSHGVVAMVLLAVLGTNWAHRIAEPIAAVLPWGGFLSVLSVLVVAITGWHGGKLVFEHQVGVATPSDEDERIEEEAARGRSPAS